MLNPRWVCPRLTCFPSKIPSLFTEVSSFTNNNKKKKKRYMDEVDIVAFILESLDSSDDVECTLDLFAENLSSKNITVILRSQSNWENVVRVFKWFKSKEWYVHNVIHYNVVLRILGRAQQWDELRLCWIDMAKNNVLPTNNTYSTLVDCYGKAGLAKESLLWIKHMMMRGIFPDEVTMSTVVKALKDVREFDRADRFYNNWCSGKVDLDDLDFDSSVFTADGSKSSVPISLKQYLSTELFKTGGGILDSNDMDDAIPEKYVLTYTYNTLIDLYGKAGQLQDAANVFADMMKSGVALDTCTFNTIIYISGSNGNLLEAESLFVKMEEKGISPNTRTYNILLYLYANVGNIDAALSCYGKIKEAGLFPDVVTYITLLGVLCTKNMVQAVEAVIDEMEKYSVSVDEHSLPDIVKMYVNEGDLDKANDLLQKFQMNKEPSSVICISIMDVFAEKGLWAEAESVFYRKRDMAQLQERDIGEFNVMIKAYGKAKLYDKAVFLFEEMKNQGFCPNDITYNSIIQMLSGADLVDQARNLTVEMQEMGFKPSCQTFSAVLGCYVRLGQLSDAVDVYQEMLRASVKPNEFVFGSIINGFAEHGSLDESLQYFDLMKESGLSANRVVLTTLVKSYTKVGDLEGVKSMYDQMYNMEGGLDLVACNSMITSFAELGLVSEARLTFENLKAAGRTNSTSYEIMMYLYKDVNLIDEAIKIAGEMERLGLLKDITSYNKVLICYTINRQYHKCVELLREMVSKKLLLNVRTLHALVIILTKGGLPIEAIEQFWSCYREKKPYAFQAAYTAMYSLLGMHTFALESAQTLLESEDAKLDSVAYNVAIYVYTSAGDVDKALNIYMKMRDKHVEPDIVTHINMVDCYGKAGLVEGVKRIHHLLECGEIERSESLIWAIKYAYKHCNRQFGHVMRFKFNSEEDSEDEGETEYDVGSDGETEYDVGSEDETEYDVWK
ncbi:hypothetical protein TSUD_213470 [Trifolium subterraneum]|uniref:Pentacotripeptide-repeat region of PRORP domain-containing protein n=1 Tax=Trifolium subterraneum TaxID=3900 RepID=A0A2Z6NJY5_TRISU|nr:hypothetical protein TSUD_213470 [Trifolium subterraneum]